VLYDEKSARSDAAKALAEEKAARLAAKQALKDTDQAKTNWPRHLR
jgi:hypothetical protein